MVPNWLAAVAALFSAITAIFSYFVSKKSVQQSDVQARISLEMQLQHDIIDASNRMDASAVELVHATTAVSDMIKRQYSDKWGKMSKYEKRKLIDKALQMDNEYRLRAQIMKADEEKFRNAFENACAMYLDGQVDKKRFERLHKNEILCLVQKQKKYYYPFAKDDTYKNTSQVYRLWTM